MRPWCQAPLGDSSKSRTAAGSGARVCVFVCLCMHASVCAADSEQKTFFVALSDNKRIQK